MHYRVIIHLFYEGGSVRPTPHPHCGKPSYLSMFGPTWAAASHQPERCHIHHSRLPKESQSHTPGHHLRRIGVLCPHMQGWPRSHHIVWRTRLFGGDLNNIDFPFKLLGNVLVLPSYLRGKYDNNPTRWTNWRI